MKPQALLVTLLVVAVLAALPLAESQGSWPCCNSCGVCTRSIPPQCKCTDTSPTGCHPSCKSCVSVGSDAAPRFVCNDRIKNFCARSCTPKEA